MGNALGVVHGEGVVRVGERRLEAEEWLAVVAVVSAECGHRRDVDAQIGLVLHGRLVVLVHRHQL